MTEYPAGHVDDYADGDRKVVICGDAERSEERRVGKECQ